jgi:3-methyladenine DNA glycosylase AlkD
VRAIRRQYSNKLREASPDFILSLARALRDDYGHRNLANELIHHHNGALQSLGAVELEELGRGINSWWSVDSFALLLAGPAWREGQVSDDLIPQWAHSEDRWWRRAALVSTVALNVKARGGSGDVPRTLQVCRLLVDDRDDMVVKGLSWALRDLVQHDRQAVRDFLAEHDDALAARVKREVRNKLATGLKNPQHKGA